MNKKTIITALLALIAMAGQQSLFINESDVPEGKIADNVMLHRFLHIVPLMDKS